MPLEWSPFVAFVRRHQRFLITTHVRPDGDALGSQLALASALEKLGKKVHRVIASPLPARYRHIDPNLQIEKFAHPGEHLLACDAIIVVDTGTWNQLGNLADFVRNSAAEKFVIDHHQTQDNLGGDRLVDTGAEACGRLVKDAIGALDVPIDAALAELLFLAISTDTGWFRHSNASAETFRTAGDLVANGANPTRTYERIYESHTLPRLHLIGLALNRLVTFADGKVAATEVYLSDYTATGAVPLDTEDLINYPRSLAGVEIALLFIEQPEGGIKVSFRSRSAIDVARLAEQFAGGGHQRAAGATVAGTLVEVRDRVLAATLPLVEALPR